MRECRGRQRCTHSFNPQPPPSGDRGLRCDPAQRCEGCTPGEELVEHPRQRLGLDLGRHQTGEALEVVEHRERDRRPYVCHLQLPRNQAQVLDRASPAHGAVRHEADGLVVPLGEEVVDRVLEHAARGVVVLRRHDHEAVVAGNLLGPPQGVRILVLPQLRRALLVEVRQREVAQVDQLEGRVVALSGEVGHPVGDLLTVAAGSGAADDDADASHNRLLVLRDLFACASNYRTPC